ncbi:N-acetylmuramoyl-L-alanine amidase [Tatumella sp. TA1]|uniref:N-acetylmuramoyl-L-alanine amidase n=1 Tax=Rosenbergiella collisarenosi TaxID=1544695 RepID=UPI0008F7EB5D|nr:N-acetylmuramoyl-L-alanine amidase [Rosenbergiella collisarenosi]QGX91038.1 N-acetylmuramoyl-L-alanine amidase [Tatumella sp. TA1]
MKKECLLFMALVSGCSSQVQRPATPQLALNTQHVALGHQPRINSIVIHYTVADERRSLELLTGQKVSSHYLIAQYPAWHRTLPEVYQLVPEDQAAWHAGISAWRGTYNLNKTSIGIELVNRGYTSSATQETCQVYPPSQIQALIQLVSGIARRYSIEPENIIGHSDIAPLRKQDPGPCFPWQQLASRGLGAWPNPALVKTLLAGRATATPVSNEVVIPLLRRYGYVIDEWDNPEQQQQVIKAFQMHFQPENISGKADQLTLARLQALLLQYPEAKE